MRICITGASGFLGSHIAAHLHAAGHHVIGAVRRVDAARRQFPHLDWVACDLRFDTVEDWQARLIEVDAVINCAGVLQDGLGEASEAVHVSGASALFEACERTKLRRVIHISAVGIDEPATSAYARTKRAGEEALKTRDLDWVILRPSLIMARTVYGGTAVMRMLAGLPWITPSVAPDQAFRPICAADVARAVAECLTAPQAVRGTWDIAGPEVKTVGETLTALRRWLGFGATRIWSVPLPLARLACRIGDGLGWLGLPSAMRTTALQQLDCDGCGDPRPWQAWSAVRPATLEAYLHSEPASVQDRWHARLAPLRPLARVVLGLFWLATGVIALGPGREAALGILNAGGFGDAVRAPLLWATSIMDIALGLTMLIGWRTRLVAVGMIGGTLAYIAAISLSLPELWLDPLGPVLKVFPGMMLAALIAATEDKR